jgi:hypothetical protein
MDAPLESLHLRAFFHLFEELNNKYYLECKCFSKANWNLFGIQKYIIEDHPQIMEKKWKIKRSCPDLMEDTQRFLNLNFFRNYIVYSKNWSAIYEQSPKIIFKIFCSKIQKTLYARLNGQSTNKYLDYQS